MKYENSSEVFGPREIKLIDIAINIGGALISGFIGSMLLVFIVFIMSSIIDLPGNFKEANINSSNPIFPFVFSFITFLVSFIVSSLTYFFLTLTDPLKYKRTVLHFGQISFLSILSYIFLAPIYIYIGTNFPNDIVIVFIVHILLISFGVIILLEILNNYRYILLGFYASFFGLFITSGITFAIFSMFTNGFAKILSLLFLLPLINILTLGFKMLFEFVYFKYYTLTGYDQLGDIFKQIEAEEEEELRLATEENERY